MDIYIIAGVVIISALVVSSIKISSASEKRKVFKNNIYSYEAKPLLMSEAEANFFTTLSDAVDNRYYVFPQVHLSALLDHRVKGQDWGFAFRHINGKSVDYVLCDKFTLKPTYAIELDDLTHERKDRVKRDIEVERIFKDAKVPLIRFSSMSISESEIIQALANARSIVSQ